MTHRLDLVRAVLLHVEEHAGDAWIDLWIYGYTEEAVSDCVRLLEQLGYLKEVSVSIGQQKFLKSVELTPSGQKLLEAARNETEWDRSKDGATELTAHLKALVGQSAGIE